MQLWNDAEALRLVLQPKLLFSSHLLWGHSRSLSRDVPFSLLEVYSFKKSYFGVNIYRRLRNGSFNILFEERRRECKPCSYRIKKET
jgi:hypothetical protein